MALTKVSGGILDPGINVAGIVTATGFDGPFTGGSTKNITAGVVTATSLDLNGNGDISGNLVIGGNLTANGDFTTLNTTLREVEILRVDASSGEPAGIITQTGAGDILRLYDGTSQVVTVLDTGEVGIGTINPSSYGGAVKLALHSSGHTGLTIAAGTGSDGNIFFADGVSGDATYRGNIKYAHNGDSMRFHTAGSERLRITSGGDVGIGTDPARRLSLFDTAACVLELNSTSSDGTSLRIQHNHADKMLLGLAGDFIVGQGNNVTDSAIRNEGELIISTGGGNEKVRIFSSGNLGVGDYSSTSLTHAIQALRTSGTTVVSAKNTNGNATFYAEASNGNTARLEVFQAGTSGYSLRTGSIDALQFYRDSTYLAQFDSSGRFLIGTTTLGHSSADDLTINNSGNGGITIRTGTSSNGAIFFADGTSGDARFDGFVQYNHGTSPYMLFGTVGDERLRITHEGEIKIPAGSNSTSRLTFGGNINIYHDGNMKFENTTGYLKLQSNNNLYIDGVELFFRNSGGTNRWKIDSSGHLLPGAVGSYNIGSTGAEIGHVYLADDKRVYFGTDQDLSMYTTGSNGFVENGTGYLLVNSSGGDTVIRSNNDVYLQPASGEHAVKATANGSVDLYYDQNNHTTPKLKTTATGITVDGEVAASQDYPNIRPILDFNFTAIKKLDPRITYQRTGLASHYDETGKLIIVGDNVPRFDHTFPEYWDEGTLGDSNSKGEPRGLLIEETRTNLYKNNHSLSTANDHASVTQTVNTTETTAPDGTFTATKVTVGGGDQWMRFDVNNGLDAVGVNFSDTFSTSVYMKTVGTSNVTVNLDFGDAGNKSFSVGQEWKRYAISNVHVNYGGSTKFIDFVLQGNIYIWGLQCENGAFPTSYIPTAGTTMTRGNESFEIDGEDFTDFFNATESTVLSHITPLDGSLGNHSGTGGVVWSFDAGGGFGNGNYFSNANSTTAFGHSVVIGSSGQNTGGGTGNMTNGVPFKNATVFKKDDFIMATNGTLASADTSGNLPTVVKLMLGNNGWGNALNSANIYFNRFSYYSKRLPNTQLVTLTS